MTRFYNTMRRSENVIFYKQLLAFAGWQSLYDAEGMLGVADKNGGSLWFIGQVKAVSNDYDGPGMNHLALAAATQAEVDAVAAYLTERDVELLFETPRHRAEFTQSAEQTYLPGDVRDPGSYTDRGCVHRAEGRVG